MLFVEALLAKKYTFHDAAPKRRAKYGCSQTLLREEGSKKVARNEGIKAVLWAMGVRRIFLYVGGKKITHEKAGCEGVQIRMLPN